MIPNDASHSHAGREAINKHVNNRAEVQSVTVPEHLTTKQAIGVEVKLHAFLIALRAFTCELYPSVKRKGPHSRSGLRAKETKSPSLTGIEHRFSGNHPVFSLVTTMHREHSYKIVNELNLIYQFDFAKLHQTQCV
jgi:hypothetical protein